MPGVVAIWGKWSLGRTCLALLFCWWWVEGSAWERRSGILKQITAIWRSCTCLPHTCPSCVAQAPVCADLCVCVWPISVALLPWNSLLLQKNLYLYVYMCVCESLHAKMESLLASWFSSASTHTYQNGFPFTYHLLLSAGFDHYCD